jgi:hypothetical protein
MEVAEALLIPFFSVCSRYQEPDFEIEAAFAKKQKPCGISRKTGIPIPMTHLILKRLQAVFQLIYSILTQDLLDISLPSCYHSGIVFIYFKKIANKGRVDRCTATGSLSVFLSATSWCGCPAAA